MTDAKEIAAVPSETHNELPNDLIDQETSILISSYEEALRGTPNFIKALEEHFFGKYPDGSVDPYTSGSNTVSFWHKGVPWEVTLTFPKKGRKMAINVSSPVGLPYQEVLLTLRSSRKDYQQITSPLVQVTGITESPRKPIIHRNTQEAIDTARQLLVFYRS